MKETMKKMLLLAVVATMALGIRAEETTKQTQQESTNKTEVKAPAEMKGSKDFLKFSRADKAKAPKQLKKLPGNVRIVKEATKEK